MAKDRTQPMMKMPGRTMLAGSSFRPRLEAEDTAPMAFATPEKMPASRKMKNIRISVSSPPPLQKLVTRSSKLMVFSSFFRMAQKTNAQMMAIRIPVFSGIVLALPVRMVEMMYRMTKMISGNNPTKLPFLFPIINSLLILDPPDRSAGRPLCHVCGLLLHQNLIKYYHKSKQISTLY